LKWQKKGLIFSPDSEGWMKTPAPVPTPLDCGEFIRVYFSSRPERRLSLTTFVDLDAEFPARVLRINPDPILEVGKPGSFDEHGIMPSCAVRDGDRVYLYYSGWSRAASVPYTNSTGLAISEDNGKTFKKVSEGPILAKNIYDPYSATSPCVLKNAEGWHMWYCSGTGWLRVDEKYEHVYDIKYARSQDGILWMPTGDIAISTVMEGDALTRPYVVHCKDTYHMWFCYRGSHDFRDGAEAYRIGYAHSPDLKFWYRDDAHVGISTSQGGWDSRMIAYPSILTCKDRTYMFYNGNRFGADGFGYAVLEN
jgi:hypothetical protein